MPDATPEQMRELAQIARVQGQLLSNEIVLECADVLDSAADQLSPRTGKPEAEGEYLVAIGDDECACYTVMCWRDGKWRSNGAFDPAKYINWWPLPPLPAAKEGM